jgi:hypothetical protein
MLFLDGPCRLPLYSRSALHWRDYCGACLFASCQPAWGETNMRRLHDPTLHFFVVWLLAPIFAIVGASLDQSACDLSTTQVGWLITLSLWNGFGIRSVVYQEQPVHIHRQCQSIVPRQPVPGNVPDIVGDACTSNRARSNAPSGSVQRSRACCAEAERLSSCGVVGAPPPGAAAGYATASCRGYQVAVALCLDQDAMCACPVYGISSASRGR